MTSDIKRFNVPINDFFDGNTEDYDGTVLKTYMLKATSSNGNEVELEINSRHLMVPGSERRCAIYNLCFDKHDQSRWWLFHH